MDTRPLAPRALALVALALSALSGGCSRPAAAEPPPSPSPGPTLRQLYGIAPVAQIAPSKTALVLVDFQREFLDGKLPVPGGPEAVARAADLLSWAR